MTTMGEVLADVRVRLDEVVGEHSWRDSELRGWVNEAVRDMARTTESMQTTESITGIIGTHEYTMPSDVVRASICEWKPTAGGVYQMEHQPLHVFKSGVSVQQEDTQGRPVWWTLWGAGPTLKLLVYPTPAEAGSFNIYLFQMPANLNTNGSADAVDLSIPTGWEDLVCDYAEFRAKRKDGDPDWQAAKAIYDQHLMDLNLTAQAWSDQSGSVMVAGGSVPGWLHGGLDGWG